MTTTRLVSTALVTSMLLVAACGGSNDAQPEPATAAATATATATAGTTVAAAGTTEASDTASTMAATPTTGEPVEPVDTAGTVGDFEPGEIEFRVVNTLDEPVDVCRRPMGCSS